ncbi:MAG: hypothetical protein M3O31_04875, partial [Acidobacteriota bacterium]|nr:hypothetical protein [Acidobacteriota bacterium]
GWDSRTETDPLHRLLERGPYRSLTLSNLIDGVTFNYALHLYLTRSGGPSSFNDTSAIGSGQAYQQQAATFTTASFSGLRVSPRGNTFAQPSLVFGSATATSANNMATVAWFEVLLIGASGLRPDSVQRPPSQSPTSV